LSGKPVLANRFFSWLGGTKNAGQYIIGLLIHPPITNQGDP
jgi:hypothetical protein